MSVNLLSVNENGTKNEREKINNSMKVYLLI